MSKERFPDVRTVPIEELFNKSINESADNITLDVEDETDDSRTAFVLFTSGSTGDPKSMFKKPHGCLVFCTKELLYMAIYKIYGFKYKKSVN